MATAKKTETAADDLLEGKKTTAKKADAKAKSAKKAAKADAGDDLLEGKSSKKASKGSDKKAAKADKPKAKKAKAADGVTPEDVRAVVNKARKLTSYADVAAAAGTDDIRMVRRTCRAMRDAGEAEIVKEGTVAYVKKA